jgi:large subunit ribosomal protein L25
MEDVLLELETREVKGKAVKHLRREGTVPAVIHDHGKDSVLVMAPFVLMNKAYHAAGKHHPVKLSVGGKHYTALIKDVDIDPRKNMLRHVVFNAVGVNEKVTAQIPVHVTYDDGNESSPAERNSLIVLHQLDTVEVEAIPAKLPDAMLFNGEKLVNVGDSVTVADLIAQDGVVITTEPTQTLATVFEPSALQAANDAAGGDVEEETTTETTDETAGKEENAAGTEQKQEEK